jgi:hypothetical protein
MSPLGDGDEARVGTAPAGAGRRRTFGIYRPSRREELVAAGRDVRTIHMVRHAQVLLPPLLKSQKTSHTRTRTHIT